MKILKAFILSILFTYNFFIVFSQDNENDRSMFLDAEYFIMTEDYPDALAAYLQLIKKYPDNSNLNYRTGLCLLNIDGQKHRSIPYLEKASNNISEKYTESTFNQDKAPPQVLFLLATAYQVNNDLDLAILTFKDYKKYLDVKDVYEIDYIDKQIRSCETAKDYLRQGETLKYAFFDNLIPDDISSFNPIMAPDRNLMIYMTQEKFYKAIWMTYKIGDKWKTPENITPQIESDGDLYPCSVTGDGKTLYLVKFNSFEGNIYLSNFENGRWGKAEKLDKPINSRFWETHAGISSDGNEIYFTSNRKGGMGGLDIYYSKKKPNGKWEDPINLGSAVNTIYNEDTPFILPDDSTLYFASQGHEGMGGYDIFKSNLQENGNWSIPINLGYPWNTTDDNVFLFPIEDSKTALYAGTASDSELSPSVKLLYHEGAEEILDEQRLIAVSGEIIFQDNLIPEMDVEFSLLDKNNVKINTDIVYNKEDQTFSLQVKPGTYKLLASSENYEPKAEIIDIQPDFNRNKLNFNLEFVPKEVSSGDYIVIKNILFDYDSFNLNREALLELERLYTVMNKYPALSIEVIGHTDSRGSPEYNFNLSKRRSGSVREYLVEKGIDPSRIIIIAAGETENIALNINPDGSDNPEGRRINRNVTIRLPQSEKFQIFVEPIKVPDHLKPDNAKVYTILLTTLDKPADNDLFQDLSQISSEGVSEHFSNSVYQYTLGRFYSKTQAEELLSSAFLSSFDEARVIDIESDIGKSDLRSNLESSEFHAFAIQIMAFRKPENSKKFKGRFDFRTIKGNDGLYRILYGEFSNREDAEEALLMVRGEGYEDAFITDLNKLIKTSESGSLNKSGDFVIQLKALRTINSNATWSGLKDVKMIKGIDNVYRYIYGNFESIDSARDELKRIKRLGFTDAFIRDFNSIPGIK
jgi:outer membrane protein OmpA-like peptidoglycan-associated protein